MPGLSTPTYDATTTNTSAAWTDYMPSLPTAVDLINPVIQWVLEPFDLQAPIRLLFCLLLLNLFRKLVGILLRASARLIHPQQQTHHHTNLLPRCLFDSLTPEQMKDWENLKEAMEAPRKQ